MRVKFTTLLEGTKYDKKAVQILSDAGLLPKEVCEELIEDLFREYIHAFVHAPSWLEKYLVGIARMWVEYANGDINKFKEFYIECSEVFDEYLTYVKEIRNKQADPAKFDREFMDKMSYQDVKDFNEKYQKELDKQSKDELSKMDFASSNYELVPIDSYEEFNSKFGGKLTGDGSSDNYAGNGGTAWCHTNNESTYKGWINRDGGKNKFFVLMNKDFKNIPFNSKTNSEKLGKDDYGNSLIALLVDKKGKLKNATLRCNHVGVSSNADNQYKTYAELSKIAGFNVEDEVMKYIDYVPPKEFVNGIYYYEGGEVQEEIKSDVEKVVVIGSLREIDQDAFNGCTNLNSISIPKTVTKIGIDAFSWCESLESIKLPENIKSIEGYTFYSCKNLKSIKLPENLTYIEEYAFESCYSLESIAIPESVRMIGGNAFSYCGSLKSFKCSARRLGASVFQRCSSLESVDLSKTSIIGSFCFSDCENLKSVILSDTLNTILDYTFYKCKSLESITIPNSVHTIRNCAFGLCRSLKSIILPESVNELGSYIFDRCTSLKSITILGDIASIDKAAFRAINDFCVIYCKPNNKKVIDYCNENGLNLKLL